MRPGTCEFSIEGVEFVFKDGMVHITGPLGQLSRKIPPRLQLTNENKDKIKIETNFEDKSLRAMAGTISSTLKNIIEGVTKGFEIIIEVVGVGYRFVEENADVKLLLGFSHPVMLSSILSKYPLVTAKVINTNTLSFRSIDPVQLGDAAAEVRSLRPPEPYNGKGVKYKNEIIPRKAGKSGKK